MLNFYMVVTKQVVADLQQKQYLWKAATNALDSQIKRFLVVVQRKKGREAIGLKLVKYFFYNIIYGVININF